MSRLKPSGSIIICLLLLWQLTGCTQWRYDLGRHLSPADVPSAEQALTLTEILADLGPPQRVSAAGSGYVLAWEHWEIIEDKLGLSLGALGTDVLSFDWGRAQIKGEFLLVTFDQEHRVTSSTMAEWNSQAGGGRAIQPLVSLVSLVDVGDLVEDLPHHQWGSALLEPIPQALNTDSRPDMGQSGIQRRGTPTGIGQQSLEINLR